MPQQYMLAAVGSNRTGVVAEISEAAYTAGCNIENSFMTLLGDHFTLMVHVGFEEEDVYRRLREKCQALQREKELMIHLFPLESGDLEESRKQRTKPHYEIRVRGQDKAGIVYRTSQLLASRGINILQLSAQVERPFRGREPQFTMRIEIEVPAEVDGQSLRRDLEALAEDLQETITLTRRED